MHCKKPAGLHSPCASPASLPACPGLPACLPASCGAAPASASATTQRAVRAARSRPWGRGGAGACRQVPACVPCPPACLAGACLCACMRALLCLPIVSPPPFPSTSSSPFLISLLLFHYFISVPSLSPPSLPFCQRPSPTCPPACLRVCMPAACVRACACSACLLACLLACLRAGDEAD